MNTLAGMIAGFLIATLLTVAVALWRRRRRDTSPAARVTTHASLERLKAIGQLSVFKVFTKEIVTTVDHAWGEWGLRWLQPILSVKKMAMIFEFQIDFRYDLRSDAFEIVAEADGTHLLRMPPCIHETSIRDIHFYDEQKSKLVPWLLPDLVNSIFGDGFTEQDRNRLKDVARHAAEGQAQSMIRSLCSEVEQSARQTLESLARAFGSEGVRFEFAPEGPTPEKGAEKAVATASQARA